MPESDLALLTQAARAAGQVALRFWRKSPRAWEKPDGAGPVTEADLAVNAALADTLRAARPDYGWLSEEDGDGDWRARPRAFIVDPIDGTRAFLAGEEFFAISLAVVQAGQALAGVVHLPARDQTFAAHHHGPALLNGAPLAPGPAQAGAVPQLLASAHALQPAHWPGGLPQVRRAFRPSLAYRLCLVAQGQMDGMLSLRPCWVWDIAAGALIARRAGAAVSDRWGGPLRLDARPPQTDGVVIARPDFHAALLAGLGQRPQ